MAPVLGPLGLQLVASFVTKRSAWKLVLSGADGEERLLRVDLDTADFGYAVGEVEALVSMEFSRQEYWSRLPFPFPGDLSDPGIEPGSPAFQADSLPSETPGKPPSIRNGEEA